MPEPVAGTSHSGVEKAENRTVGEHHNNASYLKQVENTQTHALYYNVAGLEIGWSQRVVLERTRVRGLHLGTRATLPGTGAAFTKTWVYAVHPAGGDTRCVNSTRQVGCHDQVRSQSSHTWGGILCLCDATGAERVLTGTLHNLAGITLGFCVA